MAEILNYSAGFPDIAGNFTKGIQGGIELGLRSQTPAERQHADLVNQFTQKQIDFETQKANLEKTQADVAAQKQKMVNTAVSNHFTNPSVQTANALKQTLAINDPAKFKAIQDATDAIGQDHTNLLNQTLGQALSSVQAGDQENALRVVDEHLTAAQNSLDPMVPATQFVINGLKEAKRVVQLDPKVAVPMLLSGLTSNKQGEQMAQKVLDLRKDERKAELDVTKMGFEKAQTQSLLDKTQNKIENLPTQTQKVIIDAGNIASAARQRINQANELASAYTSLNPAQGWAGKAAEGLKQLPGVGEDAVSAIKQEFQGFIGAATAEAAKGQGPLSNMERQLFAAGMPSKNSSPENISKWLGKYAKIQEAKAVHQEAMAEWITQNKNIGKANQPIEINGEVFDKGSTFGEVMKRIVEPIATGKRAEKAKPTESVEPPLPTGNISPVGQPALIPPTGAAPSFPLIGGVQATPQAAEMARKILEQRKAR